MKASFAAAALAAVLAGASVPGAAVLAADEVGDALDASIAAQHAAKESQARIDKLEAETRVLREKRRTTEWRALQLSGYAAKLEADAKVEEGKRKEIQDQIARIGATGADLQPLMRRMVDELEAFVQADLPFLRDARMERVKALRALLEDNAHGMSDKFRRVLEAYRTEVDYGHSMGAEDAEGECDAPKGPVTLVRVGRVGLYCLTADGKHGAYWADGGWQRIEDSDQLESLRHARAMARAEEPPQLLQLPVRAAVKP